MKQVFASSNKEIVALNIYSHMVFKKHFALQEYIAIRIKGYNHFIWFKTKNTLDQNGVFIGQDGWGKNGAYTNVKCRSEEITSYIHSKELNFL